MTASAAAVAAAGALAVDAKILRVDNPFIL